METRGGLLPPIDPLPLPTKTDPYVHPAASPLVTVTVCDIVHHPCLCTVSRDTASLPRAWNLLSGSLVPALRHRWPLH